MGMTTGWDLQVCNSQNKLFRDSGFEAEVAKLAERKGQGASARMAEEPSVIGPPERCREQLAALREARIALPIVNPVPVGDQTYAQGQRRHRGDRRSGRKECLTQADLHTLELRLSKQLWVTAADIVAANAAVMFGLLKLLR